MMSNDDWRHIFALVSALPNFSQIVIVQFIMQFHRLFIFLAKAKGSLHFMYSSNCC